MLIPIDRSIATLSSLRYCRTSARAPSFGRLSGTQNLIIVVICTRLGVSYTRKQLRKQNASGKSYVAFWRDVVLSGAAVITAIVLPRTSLIVFVDCEVLYQSTCVNTHCLTSNLW